MRELRERLAGPVVQRLRDERAAVVRHVLVDLAGQLDEARREVVLARLPGEVEGVDRDAVAAEAWAGLEAHEPERLRSGRLDDLPDVHPHPLAQHRELVDEGDVDGAEDVLEELRQLGRLGDDTRCTVSTAPAVQRRGGLGAGVGRPRPRPSARSASSSPRGRGRPARARTRGGSPRPPSGPLEPRVSAAGLPRRAWIGRRLEHDEVARAAGACRSPAIAAITIERSGSRCFESGVGSAIRIASASRSSS